MSGTQTDVFAWMMSLVIDDVIIYDVSTLLLLREGFGIQSRSTQIIHLLNFQGEVEYEWISNTS